VIDKREKRSCSNGCEGQFVTAPLPLRVLPKSIASDSLIAHIAIGRNLMAQWMIAVANQLQPLINLMKDQVEGYDIAAIDATSFHVMNEPGRQSQTKSYAYCIRGGPPDKKVVLYEYNAYSHKDYVDETLAHFNGVLHCDASPDVTLSYCNAHARRKFEQIEKSAKKGKAQVSTEAMRM